MNYTDSKADTEIVGTATAQLLDSLSDLGLPLSKVNCVGHSLGGHTAGVVGDRLTKGRLGMATGLDSAGPLFDSNKTPMKNKLDLNDAMFVQNVHTSIILGTKEFLGHSDFFPNGGVKQTGCKGAQEISY
ncbi:unnamed protein product, partial [Timema podura]|nr:unnamed protein product [Timema podura]